MTKLQDRAVSELRRALRRITSADTRRKLAFAVVSVRRPSGPLRPLPNLLVIGAQRCGTSSLFKYLGEHPHSRPSIRKEARFFTEFYDRGPNWYRSHFPLALTGRENGVAPVYFEATPDYLLDPRVARRATELLPDVRVLALLRDPVKRAWSHYWHNRRMGTEASSFQEALERESERIGPHLEDLERGSDVPTSKALLRYSYVERGRYGKHLERWIDVLQDPSRMLVLRSEDLFRETDATFQRILRFLDLPEWRPLEYENFSYASRRPGYPPMPPDCQRQLVETFEPEVGRLRAIGLEARLFEEWTCAQA